MWTPIQRIVRHRFAKGWRAYLSEAAMQRLTAQVAECEKAHSGEIRICIESSLPQSYLLRRDSMRRLTRQRALAKFSKLRVWDTEHNNGVLIYLLLPERCIELVADRGIDARVSPDTWAAIVAGLRSALQS
ncbi:MAG: TPM domain-containing protein, partial [Rhodoferax sp.]|nr:TPM domain-containing protein [Rhodoferax sp.]